jgi:type I restriction enzyme, S subunit
MSPLGCQAWLEDAEAIVESHVTILRPIEQLDPVFLAVFLNSRLGYLQTERAWTGSSGQIELRREAIEDFKVLVPPLKAQHVIRADIEAAHSARWRAKRLWLKATRAMEASILGEDR